MEPQPATPPATRPSLRLADVAAAELRKVLGDAVQARADRDEIIVPLHTLSGPRSLTIALSVPLPYLASISDPAVMKAARAVRLWSADLEGYLLGEVGYEPESDSLWVAAMTWSLLATRVLELRDSALLLLAIAETIPDARVQAETAFATQLAGAGVSRTVVTIGELYHAIDRGVLSDTLAAWRRLTALVEMPTALAPFEHVPDGEWGQTARPVIAVALANLESSTAARTWQTADATLRAIALSRARLCAGDVKNAILAALVDTDTPPTLEDETPEESADIAVHQARDAWHYGRIAVGFPKE